MALEQIPRYCPTCRKQVIAIRAGTNHMVHLLLTLLTGGIWLIIWLLAAIKIGGWKCMHCGRKL